jgi:hypothetical protein
MAQYLEAPKVSVLIDEKLYEITTPVSFNKTTKSGDEITIGFLTHSGSVTVGHRVVEVSGDGLSASLALDFKELPTHSVIFFYRLNKNPKSQGTIVPRASS